MSSMTTSANILGMVVESSLLRTSFAVELMGCMTETRSSPLVSRQVSDLCSAQDTRTGLGTINTTNHGRFKTHDLSNQ